MRMLRQFMILMMMIILLPWGAYAGAAEASTRANAIASVASPGVSLTTLGETADAGQSWLVAPRNCRTATLPGFPCSSDQATLPASAVPRFPDLKAACLLGADWTGVGRSDPPPKDPPRLM